MSMHQKKYASMRTVWATPRCREVVAGHVFSTQGRINIGTWTRGVRGAGGGRLLPGGVVGGRWTRRVVSSSVRCSLFLEARVRTSERCGRRAEGVKSRRSFGVGAGKSNDTKRMVAQHMGSARCFRAQVLQM